MRSDEFGACAVGASAEKGVVSVRLGDGREVRFPASKNRRLRDAAPEQLANIEIICRGTGLHWPDLDEDLSVLGILEGRLGLP
ncbi:MAG: DUF2442 domain-containing protein [Thermoguttaceae bacterium]